MRKQKKAKITSQPQTNLFILFLFHRLLFIRYGCLKFIIQCFFSPICSALVTFHLCIENLEGMKWKMKNKEAQPQFAT